MAGVLEDWQPLLIAVICVLVVLLFLQLIMGYTISSKGLNAKTEGMYQGPTGNPGDGNYLRLESLRDDAGGAFAYLPPSAKTKDSFAGGNGRNEYPVFWNPGDMTYQSAAGLSLNDDGSTGALPMVKEGLRAGPAPWSVGRRSTAYSGLDGMINGQKLAPW